VTIALAVGFASTALIFVVRPISGGHLNPAITLGAFVATRMDLVKTAVFIVAQILGAIVGSCALFAVFPSQLNSALDFGTTGLATNVPLGVGNKGIYSVSASNGVVLEILLTFVLVIVVLVTSVQGDGISNRWAYHIGPLIYGCVILVAHLVGAPFTGPSLNPARTFGPAVVSGFWENQWVGWVGPTTGAVLGGLVYHYLLFPGVKISYVDEDEWP